MTFRKFRVSIAGLILLLGLNGCEELESGPRIEWLSTVNQSYSYSASEAMKVAITKYSVNLRELQLY